MVERKRKQTARLENALGLPPAGGQQALIEGVGVLGMPGAVGHYLQRLGRVVAREMLGVAILQRKLQPDVEEVGKLGVVQQAAKRRIGNHKVVRAVFDAGEVGRRGAVQLRVPAHRVGWEYLLALAGQLLCQRWRQLAQAIIRDHLPRRVGPVPSSEDLLRT